MGKKSKTAKLLKQVKGRKYEPKTPIASEMFLPNQSGDHQAGRMLRTPVNNTDIANKKYVDDEIAGITESDPIYSAWDKDHDDLTNVTANQHHAQSHSLASHSTKAHSELTGVTADQHHAQSHTLASHSTKAHTELTGVTASQHHTKAVSGDIDHDATVNTHNLTTDIDHDALTNFAANEHFTEASISHTNILDIGTNTHAQIDTHLALTNEHIDWTNATSNFKTYTTSGNCWEVRAKADGYRTWWIDATNPDHLKKEGNIVISADPGEAKVSTQIVFRVDNQTALIIKSDYKLWLGGDLPTVNLYSGGTNLLRTDDTIQAAGYKSSDGSAGVTGSFDTDRSYVITVKNGLITNIA